MSKTNLNTKLLAIFLCLAMILSMGAVAAGEEIQDDTAASEGAQSPSEGGESTDTPSTEEDGTGEGAEEDTDTPSEGGDGTDTTPEDGTLTASDELIRVLKQLEGFSAYAFWDYKQWSIGYGSKCPEGMETYYQSNPITEEYAEELLREELDFFESELRGFIEYFELDLNQHQYDALVSFSYNVGTGWMRSNGAWKSTGNLNSAIISGDTGSHMLYGMMLWSMAGQKPSRHILINRRIIELNIYANGIYPENCFTSEAIPDRYRIVFMDGNGGVVKYEEHGFDAEQPISIKTEFKSYPTGPDENGNTVTYVFDGWYTERVGGTKVELLDTNVPTGMVLYAHWKTPSGTPVEIAQLETDLKIKVTVTGEDVNVRTGPDTYFHSLYKANPGDVLEISEVTTRGGLLWGCSDDKWIALKYTDYSDALEQYLPMWGKVTSTTLNVRTGAGTDYALVDGAQKVQGDLLLITQWKADYSSLWRGMMWGKIEEGWVALPYVTFDGVLPPDQTVQSIEIIQNPDKLSYLHMTEALDITGGKLLVTYMDGSTTTLNMTAEMVSGFDNTTIGTNTVTVTYGEKTAAFDVQIVKAKVIFRLEDGTVISEKEYLIGDTVEIPADPAQASDNIYHYTFAGWDKEVMTCDGNAVYTATFTKEYIDYTVKFLNEDGSVISEQTCHWGDGITIPDAPSKPADNTYTYAFAGWDKEVTACAGNAAYTATYQATYIEYTVIFQYEDGTVIKQYTLHYGDAVTAPVSPAAPEDYVFSGWDKTITECLGNETYTAVFVPKDYLPGDLDGNEKVNTDDVFQLLLHISLPDMFPIKGDADFNGDGSVTTDDVFQLLLHISLPDMFPL